MKLSAPGAALVALAVAMFVCVILLTPPAGFETRQISGIHPIGVFSLVLVFATAGLNAIAIALLGRRPRTSSFLAGLGIFLVLPGFILDQTGQFATTARPAAIGVLEYALITIEAALFIVAVWLYRRVRCAEAEEAPPTGDSSGPSGT